MKKGLLKCSICIIVILGIFGCAPMQFSPDNVENISDDKCRKQAVNAVKTILMKQDEKMNENTAKQYALKSIEFVEQHKQSVFTIDISEEMSLSSLYALEMPKSTQYGFTFKNVRGVCNMALIMRSKDDYKYTNTLTYIENEPVENCVCSDK